MRTVFGLDAVAYWTGPRPAGHLLNCIHGLEEIVRQSVRPIATADSNLKKSSSLKSFDGSFLPTAARSYTYFPNSLSSSARPMPFKNPGYVNRLNFIVLTAFM